MTDQTDSETRRSRRTNRPVRQFDQSVPSPCISICTLSNEGICEGCYRHQDEIRDWMIMSREEKLNCLKLTEQRMAGLFE
ncbi:MAG: putative Fe-S protein YdhL (DUF1289 family) [Parasphingorhabdus sp.]|jgi:predicted Fe-S protein YdhL (DUF1289 family)